jgi:purine-cytosine permease-like protein
VLVVGVEVVGVELVGVLDVVTVGVLVVGALAVGVLAVGVDAVDGVGAVAVPVAGSVLGGLVIVLTSEVSPEAATKAAATPPSASRKIAVTIMIGTRQSPGRRMRVVAA